jgi:hypothetical protein
VSFISAQTLRVVVAAAVLGAAATVAEPAFAAGPFRPFLGNWRGTGEITTQDSRKEPISCRATYEGDDEQSLTISLVCASDAFRINIESNVTAEEGALRGQWRETTRGVQGDLSGQVGRGDFEGQVTGPGFTASMSIRVSGRKQAVYIRPSAGDIRGVDIVLSRVK